MRTISAALDELVTRLRGAGFRADVDAERLNVDPSAVWVQPREVRDRIKDSATLVAWCYLIVSAQEAGDAMRLLDDGLEGLLELLELADSDDVIDLSAAVALPSNPTTALPAYRLATDLDL